MNFIKQLLEKIVCKHKWIFYKAVDIWDDSISKDMPCRSRETLICKRCGAIKKISL